MLALVALLLLPRVVVDVHVHTTPERTALVADLLAANGVTRFVNLGGFRPVETAWRESLAAAEPFDGRVAICANLEWRRSRPPTSPRGRWPC
ncbi:MAG: hypothetical protein R3F60_12710 [bacterium]